MLGLAALAVGLVLAAASPARAQFGMGMGGDASEFMDYAISRDAASGYGELMRFDGDQRSTMMMLHEGYLDEYKQMVDTISEAMRQIQDEMQETRDWEASMPAIGKIMLAFMDRADTLESDFMADLKMLAFEPAQEEAFVRVERARRREVASQMGTISGAGIDLYAIRKQSEVDDNEAVSAALQSYETEIDGVNKRFIDLMLGTSRTQLEKMADPDEDLWGGAMMETWQEQMATMRELGLQAKGINERFARQVKLALPPEQQPIWDLEVKRRTWPQVYRESSAERLMDAAGKFDDLDTAQREGLEALRQAYAREAAPVNQRWSEAIDEQQSGEDTWFGWGGDDTKTTEAAADRKSIDERFEQRLRDLLTPEQAERLPKSASSGFDADAVIRQFGGGG
ncbi:MAG: hypothetical protein AAFX79_05520 [Planctomycetota bacterium]